MDIITFTSTLKPSGAEYKKVVYWNRFLRVKTESIVLGILLLLGISLLYKSSGRIMFMIFGAILALYPVLIITQLNSSIKYHLAHRDDIESMPCTYTIMENGILTEVNDKNYSKFYKWTPEHKFYDRLGYYMFFDVNDLTIMVKKADIPKNSQKKVLEYIKNGRKK